LECGDKKTAWLQAHDLRTQDLKERRLLKPDARMRTPLLDFEQLENDV